MNESEAKTKWCPFANSRAVEVRTTEKQTSMGCMHREDGTGVNIQCIGSECMAWRECIDVLHHAETGEFIDTGYCGLAGKP